MTLTHKELREPREPDLTSLAGMACAGASGELLVDVSCNMELFEVDMFSLKHSGLLQHCSQRQS